MKTHYDVLNLDRSCSAKEIKESFIRLSKKYHPDKNKSSDAQRKFVEVNEAYSVLGKYNSRCKYDESLSYEKPKVVYKHYDTNTKTSYEDYVEMYARLRRRNEDMKGGYIITKSKFTAVCFCFFLMALGSGLHLLAESKTGNHSHSIACKINESRHRMREDWKLRERQHAMQKNNLDNMDRGEE